MKRYKVTYKGFVYVEANSKEEALRLAQDGADEGGMIPCFSSSTGKGRRKSAAWPLWWWLSGIMFPRKNWMLRFFT